MLEHPLRGPSEVLLRLGKSPREVSKLLHVKLEDVKRLQEVITRKAGLADAGATARFLIKRGASVQEMARQLERDDRYAKGLLHGSESEPQTGLSDLVFHQAERLIHGEECMSDDLQNLRREVLTKEILEPAAQNAVLTWYMERLPAKLLATNVFERDPKTVPGMKERIVWASDELLRHVDTGDYFGTLGRLSGYMAGRFDAALGDAGLKEMRQRNERIKSYWMEINALDRTFFLERHGVPGYLADTSLYIGAKSLSEIASKWKKSVSTVCRRYQRARNKLYKAGLEKELKKLLSVPVSEH